MKRTVIAAARRPMRKQKSAGRRAGLVVASGVVDLWKVALDAVAEEGVTALRQTLSTDEEDRARGFYFDRDRRRFIVGRGALRSILARYTGTAPEKITFGYGANGKPRLADDDVIGSSDGSNFAFNVAHSEDLALIAVTTTGEVGIDLERIRDLPDWESIASSYFARADQARMQAAASEARRNEFFRAWTRQEAQLKASGLGLGGLDERGSEWRAIGGAVESPPSAVHANAHGGFSVVSFSPNAGHIAALATVAAVRAVTCSTWIWSEPTKAGSQRRVTRIALESLSEANAEFL